MLERVGEHVHRADVGVGQQPHQRLDLTFREFLAFVDDDGVEGPGELVAVLEEPFCEVARESLHGGSVQLCPVTEPLEIADARAAVRGDVFGGNEFSQMLLRVGWAPINADPLQPTAS